jgi:wyosine [tRNA(Phe)-imidazoG37] synthetase (radical SAM superfamily)
MIAFGPVPSRRLGRSLGINNIPPKICSYACAYCQAGNTAEMRIKRREFYATAELVREVELRLEAVLQQGEQVDYLCFVPDGEPTLDVNLGRSIGQLAKFAIPVAVITNASLLDRPEVREELAVADWVSLKIDTVDESTWRSLNRPHAALDLSRVLQGIVDFRAMFTGTLVSETMLVAGMNDDPARVAATADFLANLKPDHAYLSVPTRPPRARWVNIPVASTIVRCHDVFAGKVENVEYLVGYEGSDFSAAGTPRDSILGITAVHPMREDAVRELIRKAGADWSLVEELLSDGSLCVTEHAGHRYYLRRPRRH